mmetsp:Transcript_5275/g.15498  ORF Transcript_5275/g.15498 Transcript_5275/m.15498 type:complete len:208 (-) Transcript_5275:49-672(-)
MASNAAKLDPSPHKLKPRYCVCSNSTLPASCQATPVVASPMAMPVMPNIAHLECNNSHSRNRLMSNASLNGTIVLSVGLLSPCFILPMTLPDGFFAAEPSNLSKSNCKYSTGLAKPNGSKPLSPGMEPSNHAGASAFGYQSSCSVLRRLIGAAFFFTVVFLTVVVLLTGVVFLTVVFFGAAVFFFVAAAALICKANAIFFCSIPGRG